MDAINTLNFVQGAKELGFPLAEIGNFLEIQITKKGKCSLAQEKIIEKISDIDKKIHDLKSIKRALTKVSLKCDNSTSENSCHFLELLGGLSSGK